MLDQGARLPWPHGRGIGQRQSGWPCGHLCARHSHGRDHFVPAGKLRFALLRFCKQGGRAWAELARAGRELVASHLGARTHANAHRTGGVRPLEYTLADCAAVHGGHSVNNSNRNLDLSPHCLCTGMYVCMHVKAVCRLPKSALKLSAPTPGAYSHVYMRANFRPEYCAH